MCFCLSFYSKYKLNIQLMISKFTLKELFISGSEITRIECTITNNLKLSIRNHCPKFLATGNVFFVILGLQIIPRLFIFFFQCYLRFQSIKSYPCSSQSKNWNFIFFIFCFSIFFCMLKILFYFIFIYFFQVEANYFKTFRWVLSYTDMNHPWSYIYSPSDPPSNMTQLLHEEFFPFISKASKPIS